MTIDEASKSLNDKLSQSFSPGCFTIGVGGDTIFVYEHVHGFVKSNLRTDMHEGFKVVHKYVGKMRM